MQNENQAAGIPGIDDELPELPKEDELTALKSRADLMGLSYHPSIGLEKLREKVAAAIAAEGAPNRAADAEQPVAASSPAAGSAVPTQAYQAASLAPEAATNAAEAAPRRYLSPKQRADAPSVPVEGETIAQKRVRLKRHANELIRINVTCMNPAKKEWEGEIIAGGNALVGTLTKYVPFNTDEGWHVPRILYNVLRDRMCQVFVSKKVKIGGTEQTKREGKLIKEFSIDVLEPLTKEELEELAARQAATHAID